MRVAAPQTREDHAVAGETAPARRVSHERSHDQQAPSRPCGGRGRGRWPAGDRSWRLLGSWLVKHQATDPASDEVGTGIASFIADGVLVTNDIKPAGPISTGSWEWTSSDKFQATVWSGVHESGSEGTARIKVTGKLSDGKVKGTYTFTLYDMDDKVVFTEKGDFWGEPLDARHEL